jgi:RNA polymerase sigma factor (sigma-70 family)
MNEDTELLRRFAEEGAQEAFAELVRGKVNLVYAAALRQTGGDAHLAEDVAQAVFLALARDAARLKKHAVLAGWLFTTTRFVASKAVRTQRRRQQREQEAHAMKLLSNEGNAPQWETLRPVIDEALGELKTEDRDALVLRFFEGRSLAEVGEAIGLAENSARMRVERALEKLRGRLARRGITSTGAALGVVLANQPALAVPAGLATAASSAALAGLAIEGTAVLATAGSPMGLMSAIKLSSGAVALLLVGALGGYWGGRTRSDGVQASAMNVTKDVSRAVAEPGAVAVAVPLPAVTAVKGEGRLDALRAVLDLKRRGLFSPDLTLMGGTRIITNQFIDLFELSKEEAETLRQSIRDAANNLYALESTNTEVTSEPGGDVKIVIKPFPEEGGAVYDEMRQTFAETLGPERFEAFMALGAAGMESALRDFGITRITRVVSREVSKDGEMRYRLRSVTSAPPDRNTSYVSGWMSRKQLEDSLGPMIERLPAGFVARN